jgi:hypothetical protein
MSIKPQSVDIVIVGRLNPAIITPDWLESQDVCPRGNVTQLLFEIERPGYSGGLRFETDGIKWQVADTRLTVSSTDPDRDISKVVSKVLMLLPHTPISGVGCNFHFQCDLSHWRGELPAIGDLHLKRLSDRGKALSSAIEQTIELDGNVRYRMRIESNRGSESIGIHCNFHRNTQSGFQAVEAVGQFLSDRERNQSLLASLHGAA